MEIKTWNIIKLIKQRERHRNLLEYLMVNHKVDDKLVARIVKFRNTKYVEVDEILKIIEAYFVSPFEVVVEADDKKDIAVHKLIADYNGEKFNKLCNILSKE